MRWGSNPRPLAHKTKALTNWATQAELLINISNYLIEFLIDLNILFYDHNFRFYQINYLRKKLDFKAIIIIIFMSHRHICSCFSESYFIPNLFTHKFEFFSLTILKRLCLRDKLLSNIDMCSYNSFVGKIWIKMSKFVDNNIEKLKLLMGCMDKVKGFFSTFDLFSQRVSFRFE